MDIIVGLILIPRVLVPPFSRNDIGLRWKTETWKFADVGGMLGIYSWWRTLTSGVICRIYWGERALIYNYGKEVPWLTPKMVVIFPGDFHPMVFRIRKKDSPQKKQTHRIHTLPIRVGLMVPIPSPRIVGLIPFKTDIPGSLGKHKKILQLRWPLPLDGATYRVSESLSTFWKFAPQKQPLFWTKIPCWEWS